MVALLCLRHVTVGVVVVEEVDFIRRWRDRMCSRLRGGVSILFWSRNVINGTKLFQRNFRSSKTRNGSSASCVL